MALHPPCALVQTQTVLILHQPLAAAEQWVLSQAGPLSRAEPQKQWGRGCGTVAGPQCQLCRAICSLQFGHACHNLLKTPTNHAR